MTPNKRASNIHHVMIMTLGIFKKGKTMNLDKSYEFFMPEKCKGHINIIGCGAGGSTIAEMLARTGLEKFTLYDFDTVEPHNITNQMYRACDIGKPKVEALTDIMQSINPNIKIIDGGKYTNQMLSGYVFLCVDSIELRRKICELLQPNMTIKAVFDSRMRLTDAQVYAADWSKYSDRQNLLKSMQFSDEDAKKETPVSACNIELSVAPTVRQMCTYVVANFMNFVKGNKLKNIILFDTFDFYFTTM